MTTARMNSDRSDSKTTNKPPTRCGSGENATVNASQHTVGYRHVGVGQGRAGRCRAGAGWVHSGCKAGGCRAGRSRAGQQVLGEVRWVQGSRCGCKGRAGGCRAAVQGRAHRCRGSLVPRAASASTTCARICVQEHGRRPKRRERQTR